MHTQPDTSSTSSMQPYGDNVIPVIQVAYQEHTQAHPFCYDETCPCH